MQSQTLPDPTTPPASPDYWLTAAADLRVAADRIAALAGTDTPPVFGPSLYLYSNYTETAAPRSAAVVDAIAAAFGAAATTKTEGRGTGRQTTRGVRARCGKLDIVARAVVPNPPTRAGKAASRAALEAEADQLRARVAELEAQQGGAR
ncbi:hypothetical protein ACIA59_10460 [Micromonospora haikouensis]|uniref:hypothetical protein n=1 Tax=Micromonospora haikouensis TaxID=686309 RepID=UPI0037951889